MEDDIFNVPTFWFHLLIDIKLWSFVLIFYVDVQEQRSRNLNLNWQKRSSRCSFIISSLGLPYSLISGNSSALFLDLIFRLCYTSVFSLVTRCFLYLALVHDFRGWHDATYPARTDRLHLAAKRVPHGSASKLIIRTKWKSTWKWRIWMKREKIRLENQWLISARYTRNILTLLIIWINL